MKMHCQQRMVAIEVNWLVLKFSDSYHQALKRITMHFTQCKVGIEDNW